MKGMANRGHDQGNMSPTVEDYQKPMKAYAEEGFSKTTEYISRQNREQDRMAHDVKKQHYVGRYS